MSNVRFSILQARAIQDERISDPQFRTLAALGCYGDKDGWCFPSLQTIGELLHKSPQAVSKDIAKLVELEYLEKHPRFDKDGSRRSNLYRLKFDTPPSTPEVDTPQPHVDTPSTSVVEAPSTSVVEVNDPVNDSFNLRKPKFSDPLWDVQHSITPSPEGLEAVRSAEICTNVANRLSEGFRLGEFPQSLKAQSVYKWIAKREEEGQNLQVFISWVMQDEKRAAFAFMYHKNPEDIKRDWPRVFPKESKKGGSFYG